MDTEEIYNLRAKRSGVNKAITRLEEVEDLLNEGTKAAGVFQGYAAKERNTLRNLIRYADRIAARLDTLIAEGNREVAPEGSAAPILNK